MWWQCIAYNTNTIQYNTKQSGLKESQQQQPIICLCLFTLVHLHTKVQVQYVI